MSDHKAAHPQLQDPEEELGLATFVTLEKLDGLRHLLGVPSWIEVSGMAHQKEASRGSQDILEELRILASLGPPDRQMIWSR